MIKLPDMQVYFDWMIVHIMGNLCAHLSLLGTATMPVQLLPTSQMATDQLYDY